ncbi:putative metal-dependent HD superfamily phosphohydrolase [Kribbella sp. VKM Ac-2527]|uniref:Putative metal-dependent HD superfamily phosphohydrolase n=1 Tax=Kribbella caucasensis TaxID=2512215 RepID=A0A4R6KA30_9ACTN|nr:PQQ-binding-like beta-propeller repeat protein [Kribbella sp. VKM Ac-2527]TDO46645.1 putative metal-dependent HD superfamily phosphohydrolase [Kribbella sp. VKM Ac-2527]
MSIRERWHDLIPDAGELVGDLVDRYTDRRRRAYRDRYLVTALDAADDLIQLATDPVAVQLAVWFHRAAHSDGASRADDAKASARLAAELLPRYGVSATRVAEVERLIRLTGSPDQTPAAEDDPNGAVVHDAAMAVTASAPAAYQTHAAEVRRTARDRERYAEQRHREIEQLLRTGIFRTPLARDLMEAAARANLEHERELTDEVIPARWRGWEIAALRAVAVFGALAATSLTVVGSWSPWSEPASDGAPGGVTVLLGLSGLVLTAVLYQLGRESDRRARIAAGGIAATGLIAFVVCLVRMPEVNPANGIGLRVPLFLTAAPLLMLSAGAAVAAGLLRARTRRHVPERNRGQVLAWLGTAAVVVLLLVYAAVPLAQSYVVSNNEHLSESSTPGQPAPASTLDGTVLWSVGNRSAGPFADAVATRHGIAVPDRSGGVLMLDGQTGEQRWNYRRSDVLDERPKLFALAGGAALLVRWDDAGDLVLDTATGRRIATWPPGSRDKHRDLESVDPLVTGQSVSKGSDKLRGTDLDGHTRWTYEPGRCLNISAEAANEAVVAFLDSSCGDSDRLVGLDLRTGKELWSQDRPDMPLGPIAADGVVVVVEGPESALPDLGELRAIDPRSGNDVWRTPAPSGDCIRPVPAGGLLILACETGNLTRFVAVEAATGRTAWQHQTPEVEGNRYAVSASSRVVIGTNDTGKGCKVLSVDRTGAQTVDVRAPEITADNYCRSIVYALGDLIMIETDEGAIALR